MNFRNLGQIGNKSKVAIRFRCESYDSYDSQVMIHNLCVSNPSCAELYTFAGISLIVLELDSELWIHLERRSPSAVPFGKQHRTLCKLMESFSKCLLVERADQ